MTDDHAHLGCTICGYDLRGLPTDGNCPECGTPIKQTLLGDLIRHADPDWVDHVRSGAKLILRSIVALLLLPVLWLALTGGLIAVLGLQSSPRLERVTFLVLLAAYVPALAALLLGVWRMTTPEPSRMGFEPANSARRASRAGSILFVVAALTFALKPDSMLLGFFLAHAFSLALVASLRCADHLNRRLPRVVYSRWGRRASLVIATMIILVDLTAIPVVTRLPGPQDLYSGLFVLAILGLLVCVLAALTVFEALYLALRKDERPTVGSWESTRSRGPRR